MEGIMKEGGEEKSCVYKPLMSIINKKPMPSQAKSRYAAVSSNEQLLLNYTGH